MQNEYPRWNLGALTHQVNIYDAKTGLCVDGPDVGKRFDLETGEIITDATPGTTINQSEPE
jgi:hypothetical protein